MLGLMVMMVMGCNSGGVKGEGTGGGDGIEGSLSEVLLEVGRSAENVFYSFLGLIADTLGFTAKATTKKSDVGEYFSGLGAKLGEASAELEAVAKKSEVGADKSDLSENPIRVAVNVAKGVLNTLKGHLELLGTVGDDKVVGEAASNAQGTAPTDIELKKAYNALKGIVDTAVKGGVTKPKTGDIAVKVGSADNKEGAKILAAGANAGAAVGDKAAAIVSSVSGEEILAAIVKSTEADATAAISANVDNTTSALKFARGGNQADQLAQDAALAGAVSGGIALRSLIKAGKLAANNNDDDKVAQAVGISASNKLLVAIEDIMKKTVKNVLEKVKQEVDKAREPKAAGQ
ncbi:variable large family protein [Borrelia crocidurae]|uniref:Variable large protein n=1 Tax=Borrelia crocidurae (strain Achema) TaxID=1155096 RepID=I0FF40_BORCA|nr:variable large family protein [Borrelia crocidurae]AFI32096.1 VlpA21H [Borrelia crocidurae str. Achema]